MCGILFTLRRTPPTAPAHDAPPPSPLAALVSRRGPDLTHTHQAQHSSHTLTFTASVLSLRGPQRPRAITPQPLVDAATGSVLCWNGEAWRVGGAPLPAGTNDAAAVFALLLQRQGGDVPGVMQHVHGPWAMVYWDAPRGRLWYGRDVLGRRSLLCRPEDGGGGGGGGGLVLASVGDGGAAWREVDADGLRWVQVGGGEGERGLVPWAWEEDVRSTGTSTPYMKMPFGKLNTCTASAGTAPSDAEVQAFGRVLRESVRARVGDIPHRGGDGGDGGARVAVLFSGGLDCTVLAALVHACLPPGEPVDLLNVAFENPRVIGARNAAQQQGTKKPKKKKKEEKKQHRGQQEAEAEAQAQAEEEVEAPPEPEPEPEPEPADAYELCPDRITGRRSHAALLAVCPRPWRLHALNIPQPTLHAHRAAIVALMHPHNTEMDLSIATAFYFASRGLSPTAATAARVLISGLGADELLGGYARHTTALRTHGAAALAAQLQLDLSRLGRRNLGRDDRVLSHWGREARYPFLDEAVVDHCVRGGLGGKRDKALLRLLAAHIGLHAVAGEPKRAVQFGSRSARMQAGGGGRTRGADVLQAEVCVLPFLPFVLSFACVCEGAGEGPVMRPDTFELVPGAAAPGPPDCATASLCLPLCLPACLPAVRARSGRSVVRATTWPDRPHWPHWLAASERVSGRGTRRRCGGGGSRDGLKASLRSSQGRRSSLRSAVGVRARECGAERANGRGRVGSG